MRQICTRTSSTGASLTALLLAVGSSICFAQQPNYTLQTNESGASKQYIARDYISLKPGFQYAATGEHSFHAKIDAGLLFPPTENTYALPNGQITTDPNQGSVVGSIPGQFAVSPTGAATYTIPIECPPGINGMQPNIALVYNSQAGNGIVGWGWNLSGVSAITRTGSTLYHDGKISEIKLDSTDNYMLDGQRLFKITGSSNSFDAEYKLEIENYSKIVTKANTHMYFEITTKDGLILQYGSTDDSRIDAIDQDKRIAWLLKKITDSNGNYILYNYDKPLEEQTGEVRLKEIKYTGNSINNTSPAYTIEFMYGERPDIQYSYIGGSMVSTTRLISEINVKSGNYFLSRYILYYDWNNINSKLTKVILHNDSYEKLSPTSILWGENNENITTEIFSPDGLYKPYNQSFWYADFSGDGKIDMVTYIPDSTKLVFYIADGTNKFMKRWRESQFVYDANQEETFETIIPGDFDADGLTDFVLVTKGKNNATSGPDYVYSHTLFSNRNFEPYPGFKISGGRTMQPTVGLAGDFNGDKKLELVFENTAYTYRLSDFPANNMVYSGGIVWGQKTHTADFPNNKYLLDFNGDGKTDIMVLDETGYRIYTMVRVNLNNEYQLLYSGSYPTYNTGVYFADFNGDGKTDILTQKVAYDNTDNETAILFSTGKGFYTKNLPEMKQHLTKLFTGDFDGNGRSDIAYFASAANLRIRLATGLSFGEEKNFSITSGVNYLNNIVVADFNGDNKDEIINNKYINPFGNNILSYSFRKYGEDLNVIKITNGLGANTDITYDYTHNSAVYDPQNRYQHAYPIVGFNYNMRVVKKHTIQSGETSLSTEMKYYSARSHLHGKGFLGFNKVESKDTQSNIITTTTYGYNTSFYNIFVNDITTNLGNTVLSSSIFTNSNKELGGKRIFPYVSSQISTDNLTGLSETKIISDFDAYGNPRWVQTTKGDLVETRITSYIQKGSWCPNKPKGVATITFYAGQSETKEVSYDYDGNGNLTKETVNSNNAEYKVTTEYKDLNAFGQPQTIEVKARDAAGVEQARISSQTYTPSGRFIASKTNVLGETTTYDWDETHALLNSETTKGKTTYYSYDVFGRLKGTHYPDGNRKTQVLQWASPGNSIGAKYYSYTQTSGSAPVITWFDALGREIQKDTYGLNNRKISVSTEYYMSGVNKGRLYRVSEPYFEGDTKTWAETYSVYDAYGRPTTVQTPMGNTTTVYSGLSTTISTPEGSKTTILNNSGFMASSTVNGKTVFYTYYSSGLTKTATPQGGQTLSMEYNLQGKRTKITDPDAGVIESRYNGFGELVEEKQLVHLDQPAIITTNNYDSKGLLQSINRNGEITSYTYDGDLGYPGRIKSIEIQGKHRQSFEYDGLSRVIATTEQMDGKSWTSRTEYTTLGQIKKETYPSGYYTQNKYDKYGHLTEVSDRNGRQLWKAVDENARGQLLEEKRGGRATHFSYDPRGFTTHISAPGIIDRGYSFDTKGNLSSQTDYTVAQEEDYSYDDLNRLTHWTVYNHPDAFEVYHEMTYDAYGNIREKSDMTGFEEPGFNMNYGENGKPHALTSIDGIPESFSASDLTITYTDFKKIKTLFAGDKEYELFYGVDDQRRKSVYTEKQGAERYTYTQYYLGNYEEMIDFLGNVKKIHYLSGGAILIQDASTERLYYAYSDYLGSLVALADETGNVVECYAYDPWGRRRNPDNWTQDDTRADWIVNRGYTGHEHLDAFGIINMNGRVYDPLTAQFLSPDPYVQAPDNWLNYNRYAYCWNNPLKYTDPDGEWVHIVVGAVVGGIINVATNWDNLDSFGEGLASFGIGAATGALTAVNPALGAVVGGAFTSAGNNVIAQTGNGVGLNQVNWGQVGGQAVLGAVVGGVTYGVGSAINQTGITNKILDASGITNNVARNIVGSTVNGVMVGTTVGLARGVGTGLVTGEWNVWEHTWKGAAYGGAGGFLYGSLTELGYQAQLKFGRNDALNSKNTDAIAKGGQRYVNRLQKIDGSNNGGSGNSATGQGMGEITVVYNTQTGTTTVYITVSPNSYWQPPAPYQYNSPTIYQNILRINK